jgi:hypothetical protein
MSDFPGSAVVPTASVGVPPKESLARSMTDARNQESPGSFVNCQSREWNEAFGVMRRSREVWCMEADMEGPLKATHGAGAARFHA